MSTYFIVLACSIIVPFAASFDKRIAFHLRWKYFFPAVLISASLFLVWDILFTKMGVWGFNPMHVQGWYVLALPVEEILFFIFIPYACVFSYEALKLLADDTWFKKQASIITCVLAVICLANILLFYPRAYPTATFTLLLSLLGINFFVLKPDYLGRFYLSYAIMSIPFLAVNGVLTGSLIEQEVVWYNPNQIIGLRIGTIPFEDYFYGLLLMLLTTNIYEMLMKKFDIKKT
jgi:lycopene cyclase domain-containing protein